jgi:hypothetical protein
MALAFQSQKRFIQKSFIQKHTPVPPLLKMFQTAKKTGVSPGS